MANGFINPHSAEIRQGAIDEFSSTWHDYTSPSAAIKAIAEKWDVGRTTLTEWVQDEGVWPRPTMSQLRHLQAENRRLKALLNQETCS